MKKLLLGSIALTGMLLGPAVAADLRVKAPPPPAPVFSWTGCYVGANVGWVGSRDNFDLAPSGNYLTPAAVPSPPNAAGSGLLPGDITLVTNSYSNSSSGIEIGPQVGCNWQSGRFVLGGEADIQWTSLKSQINAAYGAIGSVNPAFTIAPHTEHATSRLDWFSTVRARVGVAIDRTLLYVTGGVVIGGLRSDTAVTFGANPGPGFPVLASANHLGSASTTRVGWVAGVGGEYAFTSNWSVKAEYLYLDLGSYSYNSPLVALPGVPAGYSWSTNVREQDHVVRVGVNYRWGGPILAKY